MVPKSTSQTSSISSNERQKGNIKVDFFFQSIEFIFLVEDMDKSSQSPQQTDDEDEDDVDIEENVDEEHATSSNSN